MIIMSLTLIFHYYLSNYYYTLVIADFLEDIKINQTRIEFVMKKSSILEFSKKENFNNIILKYNINDKITVNLVFKNNILQRIELIKNDISLNNELIERILFNLSKNNELYNKIYLLHKRKNTTLYKSKPFIHKMKKYIGTSTSFVKQKISISRIYDFKNQFLTELIICSYENDN